MNYPCNLYLLYNKHDRSNAVMKTKHAQFEYFIDLVCMNG